MIDIAGYIPIEDIGCKKPRLFLESYQKLPKNRNKLRRYKTKTILQLLEMEIPQQDQLHLRTVQKNVERITTFFQYAINEQFYTGNNPFKGLPLKKPEKKPVVIYTRDDLNAIFSSSYYAEDSLKRYSNSGSQYWGFSLERGWMNWQV